MLQPLISSSPKSESGQLPSPRPRPLSPEVRGSIQRFGAALMKYFGYLMDHPLMDRTSWLR
jgi:hypothetical protein